MGNFFQELRRRNVVRVAGVYAVVGWILVQIGTTLEESMGLPAWFDGLIVALLLLGLPIALIFAWAYEMTPSGVVRTSDVPEGESITAETGSKLDYVIVVGILALGAIILWQGSRGPVGNNDADTAAAVPAAVDESLISESAPDGSLEPLEKSIAVLPFANRSPNPDDAFFADGMHDDLLTHLSKIRDMHVISRTSVMGYAGTDQKIPDIAHELGVATVMEGAVQRAGNRVRINVQLIDAATDAHLWAEIYDRELTADNIFDIQSEITEAIAGALNSVLSSADKQELNKKPTEILEAYDAYMEGRLHVSVYFAGFDRVEKAIAAFEKAIELDPQFAAAYAGKAYAEISAYWYTAAEGPWRERALASLQQAEALAPDAVETLAARGYYHYWGFLDYEPANAAFSSALAKSPNFMDAIAGHAFSMRRQGRFDDTIATLERGHRLDPLNMDVALSLAETYAKLGRFTEARAGLQRARSINSATGFDPSQGSLILKTTGDSAGAYATAMEPTPSLSANLFDYRTRCAVNTRDPENVQITLETWPEEFRRPGESPEAFELAKARALLFLGENDEAQRLLAEIKARLDASPRPYPQGWKANAIYWPVELSGLMGDLDGVRAAVADYETTTLPDAFGELTVLPAIATAFVLAGDPDAAFSYIDRLLDRQGPWVYAELSAEVAFDPVRNDPRWLELESNYETWAATGQ